MDLRAMLGERFQDEGAEEARVQEGHDEQMVIGGNGGAVRDRPVKVIPCPRCQSMNTKFCYYNNYSVTQPRHFCRNCQRYWTVGGTLRNVPVGGGSRKKTRTRARSDPYHIAAYDDTDAPQTSTLNADSLLHASTCMQQLSMLPPPSLAFPGGFSTQTSHLPFLQSALDGLSGNLNPRKASPGLQEVPDMQSFYDSPQIAPPMSAQPMLMNGLSSFFTLGMSLPALQSPEPLVSAMAKAGSWSQTTMAELPSSQFDGYGHRNLGQNVLAGNLKIAGLWENSTSMPGRPVMDDRLVPHAAWDSNPSTTHNTPNLSPNGSSTGTDHHHLTFSHGGYYEDVSQPWVALHATDVLNF